MGTVEVIAKLCKNAGTSLAAIEKELDFGKGTIYRWNEKIPSADKIKKVADYFNVSTDYLLGREDEETDEIMALREQLRRQPGMRILFDASKNATKEQLEAMAEMIKKWTT